MGAEASKAETQGREGQSLASGRRRARELVVVGSLFMGMIVWLWLWFWSWFVYMCTQTETSRVGR